MKIKWRTSRTETVKEIWDFLEEMSKQSLRNRPQPSAEDLTNSEEEILRTDDEEIEEPTESGR